MIEARNNLLFDATGIARMTVTLATTPSAALAGTTVQA